MLKLARALFVITLIIVALGGVSMYLTLTRGEKMLQNSAFAANEQLQAAAVKAKAQIEDLKAHLPLRIASLVAGLGAAVLGLVMSRRRSRSTAFFVLSGLGLVLALFALATQNWLPGGAALAGLLFAFFKLLALTKGGAVLPEEF